MGPPDPRLPYQAYNRGMPPLFPPAREQSTTRLLFRYP